MITTRRYTKADIPDLIQYLKDEALKPYHYGKIRFDAEKVRNLLAGNVNNKMFFCNVAEEDGVILGAMVASVSQYAFSYEAYAVDFITFMREGHRSLKGITTLVADYIAWAKERRCREIRWSQSTGFKMEKFALLAKRLGFEQIGTHFRMELSK